MIITVTLLASILVTSIAVWLFRQRLAQHLPSKETMTTVCLFAAVAVLLVVVLLPDVLLLVYTLSLMPHSLRIVLALAAATMVCIGCFKQNPQPAKPALIHWKGQDGGYEDTTAAPDKAAVNSQ
jgi:hypothetical protein